GRVTVAQHQVTDGGELPGAPPGGRVVQGQDEVGGGRLLDPAGDDVPGLEPVRQADHAVVVAERRADPGGDGLGRGHAGQHGDRHAGPAVRLRRDLLDDGGGDGEDGRGAGRDDGEL